MVLYLCAYCKLSSTDAGVVVHLVDAGTVVLTGAGETLVQLRLTVQPNKPTGTRAVVVIEQILQWVTSLWWITTS